jgi:hypothetical protein
MRLNAAEKIQPVLYIEDLDVIAKAFRNIAGPVLLQISSYNANNNNPHRVIEPRISAALKGNEFDCEGMVEADGNMISLVYGRKIKLWESSESLGQGFAKWRWPFSSLGSAII